MADQTPEELDALVIWRPITTAPRDGSWFIACTDHGTERVVHFADGEHDRFPVAHDGRVWVTAPTKWAPLSAITALRAQIDRERAATIEAAVKACEAVAGNWSCGHMPPHCDCARDVEQWHFAADEVRALHTDATRAAMDAIRREGYEAGCDATMRAMLATQLPPGPDYRKFWWLVQFVLQPSIKLQLATGSTPDPDTTPRK